MVTLAEAIAESQAKFGDAFVKVAGTSGFSTLSPQRQVAAAQAVNERAENTRRIFAPSPERQQFIRGQSQDIVNLFKLGSASQDLSGAIAQQAQVREEQRAETFSSINSLSEIVGQVNERLSTQVTNLGESVQQASSAASGKDNPLGFLTQNPLLFGLGVGGLAVAGIVLIIALK
jgi:hypothetical protein